MPEIERFTQIPRSAGQGSSLFGSETRPPGSSFPKHPHAPQPPHSAHGFLIDIF